MPHRILNLDEVADYLHLACEDVRALVRDGDIPHEMRGGRPVFRRVEMDAWASRRILGLEADRVAAYHARTRATANAAGLTALVEEAFIAPALASRTKASVLRDLVALADRNGLVHDSKALVASLVEREALCSTGLPGGLAIPHPRHHHPWLFGRSFVVIGRCVQALPFGAADRRPTDLFFLLGCQDDRLHLRTLARLCLLAQKTLLLEGLRAADDASAMRAALLDAEHAALQLEPPAKRPKGKPL
ncbi:MAG: PTS sugar transporter subunit IIA [Verrucomicrobiae bacterium]|nr:PTS sugar transporter subunit IIA [Verrucomicrobiae bacterium]